MLLCMKSSGQEDRTSSPHEVGDNRCSSCCTSPRSDLNLMWPNTLPWLSLNVPSRTVCPRWRILRPQLRCLYWSFMALTTTMLLQPMLLKHSHAPLQRNLNAQKRTWMHRNHNGHSSKMSGKSINYGLEWLVRRPLWNYVLHARLSCREPCSTFWVRILWLRWTNHHYWPTFNKRR